MSDNTNTNNAQPFQFSLSLSGVSAAEGAVQIDQGYHKMIVRQAYQRPENLNRVVFRLEVLDGPFKGGRITTGLNIPKDESDNVRYYWRAALESVGYTPAQLDAGAVNLSPATFEGRTAHVYYEPKSVTGTEYETVKFLTPSTWEERRVNFVPSAPAPVAAPPPTMPPVMTTAALGATPTQVAPSPAVAAAASMNNTDAAKMLQTLGLS
jgi:hypothetical protein